MRRSVEGGWKRAAKYLAGRLSYRLSGLDGGKEREFLPIRIHCENLSLVFSLQPLSRSLPAPPSAALPLEAGLSVSDAMENEVDLWGI